MLPPIITEPSAAASQIVLFIETLKLSAGKYVGRPFVLRDWQKQIIYHWFKEDKRGRRVVKQGLLSIARKQGKSELVAGIALAIMSLKSTRLENSQGIISATTRDQASLIFRIISYFIMTDKFLFKQFLFSHKILFNFISFYGYRGDRERQN